MAPLKVHGIVLRYVNYREADRILTLLTAEMGKISVTARGCRKPRSKLRAACDYLVCSEFMLRRVGETLQATSCAVLDSFFELRSDYEALCTAFYMRDFCETVSGEGQPGGPLFTLLIRCLNALCHAKADPDVVRTAFEIRAMDALGLGPSLSRCVRCGDEAQPRPMFSVSGGGVVCGRCAGEGGVVTVLPGSVAALRQLREIDFDTLPVVTLARAVGRDLAGFWRDYLTWYLDRRFRSADFAEKLNVFSKDRLPR
ncbi:MAG: DNA repair protein RecO [Christensenellales bacterium]|jgi:DNA repair protein RecO (recombination protein O)